MEHGIHCRRYGNRIVVNPARSTRHRRRRGLPYFGGIENPHFRSVKHDPVLVRQLPVKNLTLADGTVCPVVSVYDLVLANYGLDRGLEDENSAKDYAEIKPYTLPGRANYRRSAPVY